MKKSVLFSLLLFLSSAWLCAQQDELRAREIFDFVMAGKGDSVYVRMNDHGRQMVAPIVFNEAFSSLEKQFGKYQSHSEWKTDKASGIPMYYCDVKFEKYDLRFLAAFDADGRANTIRFVPVPAPVKPVLMDTDKIEESRLDIQSGKFTLPGTLTRPKGENNAPVVILVHGSGPNDRDETVGPNKPFRDLAWGLAKQGIASVRYDKRTLVYGQEFAPEGSGTYDDETVDDAIAAVEQVKSIGQIDPGQVYVVGHSLGAMLAPRIAERCEGLAGIVMIAGNARPLEDLIPEQMSYLASQEGVTPDKKAGLEEIRKQAANIKNIGTEKYDQAIPLLLGLPYAYWEFSNSYKQVDVARKLTLPILILQGERDYQVTMEDFGLWRQALHRHKNVAFKSYPKLNHLLQEGSGKSIPMEYRQENSVPDYVMEDIADWIKDKNSVKL